MRKKLAVLCGAFLLTMLLTISASAAAPRFEDVSADTPYAESILYLADHGITNGTDSRLFSPDAPVTTRQWAVLLCRAYGLEADGTTWAEQGQNAVRQVYQKGWMEATALSAPMRMCRGAFYKSAFAVAGITVYDNTLYGGEPLSDHENCLRAARELHLCGDDADLLEIVTRGEAAQALHGVLMGLGLAHVKGYLPLKVLPVVGNGIVHVHRVPDEIG